MEYMMEQYLGNFNISKDSEIYNISMLISHELNNMCSEELLKNDNTRRIRLSIGNFINGDVFFKNHSGESLVNTILGIIENNYCEDLKEKILDSYRKKELDFNFIASCFMGFYLACICYSEFRNNKKYERNDDIIKAFIGKFNIPIDKMNVVYEMYRLELDLLMRMYEESKNDPSGQLPPLPFQIAGVPTLMSFFISDMQCIKDKIGDGYSFKLDDTYNLSTPILMRGYYEDDHSLVLGSSVAYWMQLFAERFCEVDKNVTDKLEMSSYDGIIVAI